jgi:hypothetical protein
LPRRVDTVRASWKGKSVVNIEIIKAKQRNERKKENGKKRKKRLPSKVLIW